MKRPSGKKGGARLRKYRSEIDLSEITDDDELLSNIAIINKITLSDMLRAELMHVLNGELDVEPQEVVPG